jgi:hypothetical protein
VLFRSTAQPIPPQPPANRLLTVRQDGKGDHKTIQAAIDAAGVGDIIEIQDSAVYCERIVLPEAKDQITLRGKKGCWPIITSATQAEGWDSLVEIAGKSIVLERLLLIHAKPKLPDPCTVRRIGSEGKGDLQLRSVLAGIAAGDAIRTTKRNAGKYEFASCVFVGNLFLESDKEDWQLFFGQSLEVKDSTLLRGDAFVRMHRGSTKFQNVLAPRILVDALDLRNCTILKEIALGSEAVILRDSILPKFKMADNVSMEYCNVLDRSILTSGKIGKGCFSAVPQFADPKDFDWRLLPTSPCRGKASDGGDIGCRYTPQMIEILKKALSFRDRGLIKIGDGANR